MADKTTRSLQLGYLRGTHVRRKEEVGEHVLPPAAAGRDEGGGARADGGRTAAGRGGGQVTRVPSLSSAARSTSRRGACHEADARAGPRA